MNNKFEYRMSQAGKCARALSAIRQGLDPAEPPQYLKLAAEEGNWHEQRIKHNLQCLKHEIKDEQKEVRIEYGNVLLVGHIDGIIDGDKLLEVKSMSQFEYDKWIKNKFDAFPNYAAQIVCYMNATGLKNTYYVVKNRNSGHTSTHVFSEDEIPADFDVILQKFVAVEHHHYAGQLVDIEYDANSIECKRCDYSYLCQTKSPVLSPAKEEELQEAVDRVRIGNQLKVVAETHIREGKKILLDHTKATGINKWDYDYMNINLVTVSRETYDKEILEQLFAPDDLVNALKISESEQLRLIDHKEDNNG